MKATKRRDGRSALVLFTRDLRVHDHRGLHEAAKTHDRVLPLFVLDDDLVRSHRSPNRSAFLLESLADLRGSLRERGGDLVVRRGDPVAETVRLARASRCETVFLSEDASPYAAQRGHRLARECLGAGLRLRLDDSTAVVPPGLVAPEGSDHYRVFTPYWRRWRELSSTASTRAPGRVALPDGIEPGEIPKLRALTDGTPSPERARGGERAGRDRLTSWLARGLPRYEHERDRLDADVSSRLSPYLHFGCLSARELEARVRRRTDDESFVRQLCWRDFFLQLLAANPRTTREDFRPRDDGRRRDDEALGRWRAGRTGYPIVDAGMRQLAREGWMPNRARLIAGSFLVRTLGIDWRLGARVFFELLVDGDLASNTGNWQWVAGTGANPRPNRALDAIRQARAFDPRGAYVRRFVPELAHLRGAAIHTPWTASTSRPPDYPSRLDVPGA